MIIIRHRCNSVADLKRVPGEFGVEIDLRSRGSELVLGHEPFSPGESFQRWLESYAHRMIILNVKEEGLEDSVVGALAEREITSFFFLDQSFPFLIRSARRGEKRCAVRVSEYECIQTALNVAGTVDWVWLDCFTRFPVAVEDLERLKEAGFKLCVVSPELQGRNDPREVAAMRAVIGDESRIDAVCTKAPELWR